MSPAERKVALQKARNLAEQIDAILADVEDSLEAEGKPCEGAGDVMGVVYDRINSLE